MIKVQSTTKFSIGDIVYDNDTGECFEVIKCTKFFMQDNYGVTMKRLK